MLSQKCCGVDLQSKLSGSTLQCICTVVDVGRISIDLLADMERKLEETTSRTFDRADDLLLHILGKLDVQRYLFDVV